MGTSPHNQAAMFSATLVLLSVCSCALGGVVVSPQVVRVPSQDSAIIQSHRLGGNFAYSVAEAHAFGVQTPIVQQLVVPTGVTYHQGAPQVQTHTSVVKQQIPQFGVVRTQHTVPLQYSVVQQPTVHLSAVQQPSVLLSGVQQSVHTVQQPVVTQYSGVPTIGHPVVQYVTNAAEKKTE